MTRLRSSFARLTVLVVLLLTAPVAEALPPETLASVVSVLPDRPNPAPRGAAPEGSGVVIRPGLVATAAHVIEGARGVDIRLSDGRVLPAQVIATDTKTDIAMLRVARDLPALDLAPVTGLAQPVCAMGNAFGLGLSVTCGVVSATGVSAAGFNPVEDFIQTDAAINPGMSGGALLNEEGQLVGLISAIFASDADANVGVNFAVSAALLQQVADALVADAAFTLPNPGWRLVPPGRRVLERVAAPVLADLLPDGPAAGAGLRRGDLIVAIGENRVRTPRDAIRALALLPSGRESFDVTIDRQGAELVLQVVLAAPAPSVAAPVTPPSDCPHPPAICAMRQAVFPISSFDPVGSATRIDTDLLVTNRHVLGDQMEATVFTPNGPRTGRVIASAYGGDLVLLQVEGLPPDGQIAAPATSATPPETVFTIGADVAREVVRVFAPGGQIAPPAPEGRFNRLHVTARMQPGVSGGAVVDETGALVGIAVGGGDGRFEAIPVAQVQALLAQRSYPEAGEITARLGAAFAACATAIDAADRDMMAAVCAEADNPGQLLEASRTLTDLRALDDAVALTAQALTQVPNSLNTRITHLVVLQLSARFADMVPHARRVIAMAPDDPSVLRFAIQAGLWGGDLELAEEGYGLLLKADPVQARAARRFLDTAPPAPPRRP